MNKYFELDFLFAIKKKKLKGGMRENFKNANYA